MQIIINQIVMGSQICNREISQSHLAQLPLEYQFDEDNKQLHIPHEDRIICNAANIEKNIRDCQEKLQKSQKLYKDKAMKTESIILKSLTGHDDEVKCTFERPYVFLNLSTSGRGKSYPIVDLNDCKSSQIIVRDEALQYFGVFLCFLADNPNLIKDIFLTEANSYGIHCVSMNINSIRQPVYIDDYILCEERLPFFTQPTKGRNERFMWTCLLEKAWMKANGTIAKAIRKTEPVEVFQTFLSYPTRTYVLKEKSNGNDIQNRDIEAFNIRLLRDNLLNLQRGKGCIVTTKQQPKHKIGISGRKYFYFIKAIQLQGKRYYYFRNPCVESFDFRGNLSHLDEDFLKKLRVAGQIEEPRIPEGNFLLEEEEALEQLESLLIIHYQLGSAVISQEMLHLEEQKEHFVQFQLPTRGEVSISVNQFSSNQDNLYSPLSFLIFSYAEARTVSDLQNSEGSFGVKNTYLLQNIYTKLNAGNYLIRLVKKANIPKIQRIGQTTERLIVTAPFKVQFAQKQQSKLRGKYESFLKDLAGKTLQESMLSSKKNKTDFVHVGCWIGDLATVFIKNKINGGKALKLEVGFPELQNLKCISHPNIHKEFIVLENVGEELLLIFEKVDLTAETRLGKYVIESF